MPSNLRNGGFTGGNTVGGGVHGSLREFKIANGLATNLMPGDPVSLANDGTVVKASVSTQNVLGVMVALVPEGQNTYIPARYFASGASVTNSTNTFRCLVAADPFEVFECQFDGSVSQGDVGANFDVVTSTGDTVFGISTARVHASSRSDTAGMVKLVEFSSRKDNAITDAYPYGLFKFNNHQFNTAVSAG
jgi:hypothetical protein